MVENSRIFEFWSSDQMTNERAFGWVARCSMPEGKRHNRDNGPYFQNEIENAPFESLQEKKSPIRRKCDTIIAFPNDR